MKLSDLVEVIDPGRQNGEEIQIVEPGTELDCFTTFSTTSVFLEPFMDRKVKFIYAVKNVIRIELEE